jgi:hypothetical protein
MPKTISDDAILRGLPALARDGLDDAITPRALGNMIDRGHLQIEKFAGRYTSTRRRIREAFERAMDGEKRR